MFFIITVSVCEMGYMSALIYVNNRWGDAVEGDSGCEKVSTDLSVDSEVVSIPWQLFATM
jgi:hypothetical protein